MTTYNNYTLANLENDQLIIKSRTPKVPLYVAVYDVIYGLIRNGELKTGDKIPSENYLAEHLAVARSTVRMAILVLQEDGILVTHHGKGTFVAETKKENNGSSGNVYFVHDFVRANHKEYGYKDGVFSVIPREDFLDEKLQATEDDTLAMILKTHLADNEVVAFTQDFFKIDHQLMRPDMDFETANKVFIDWVREVTDRVSVTFTPANPTQDVKKILGSGSSKAILLASYEISSLGKPIAFSKCYYNTKRIKVKVTMEY